MHRSIRRRGGGCRLHVIGIHSRACATRCLVGHGDTSEGLRALRLSLTRGGGAWECGPCALRRVRCYAIKGGRRCHGALSPCGERWAFRPMNLYFSRCAVLTVSRGSLLFSRCFRYVIRVSLRQRRETPSLAGALPPSPSRWLLSLLASLSTLRRL